ncbi:hypothetical protein G3I40_11135 [Streptomyces sp. SID14478]|uniref:hypothetical protein n=1 Tax=Streptomyces sp. SID14478 TaxID=2706073 RepID=UPI0013DB83E4|nr:hypothetical protein [Streptomyces sp. SID14478]NEB75779.1 hypothetical protein [Streptomyces sp. SID14478]
MKQIARRTTVVALLAAAAVLPLTGVAQAATPQAPAQSVAAAHPCDNDWECWHHSHHHHDGLGLGLGLGLGVGLG